MALAALAPSWVLPNAKFDFDFANGRYWGGNVHVGDINPSQNRPGTMCGPSQQIAVNPAAVDSNGNVINFPVNQTTNRIVARLGLLSEGSSTNQLLWCRDQTNAAWVKTNITATKNQIGADGTSNSACLLTATAGGGTSLQSVTLASNALLGSCFVKRVTGSGAVTMTIDGATFTDITAQLNGATYARVSIPIQTITNPVMGFALATSGDAIAVDFAQLEATSYQGTTYRSVPSSPILTTTAATQRLNEHISFANQASGGAGLICGGQTMLGNVVFSGAPYSWLIMYAGSPTAGGGLTFGTDAGGPVGIAYGGANGTGAAYVATTTANVGNVGVANWNKQAGRTNGLGSSQCLNGGAIVSCAGNVNYVPQAPATAWTHGSWGNNGSGTTGSPLNGYISRFTLWDREITDGQMLEYTR